MMRSRISTALLGLLAGAGMAWAQMPTPPVPPTPPTPPAAPVAPVAPMPAVAPALPALPALDLQLDLQLDAPELAREAAERARAAAEEIRQRFDGMDFRLDGSELAHEAAERAAEKAMAKAEEIQARVAEMQSSFGAGFAQRATSGNASHDSESRLYQRGQGAIEGHRWDEALESFSQVAARGGSRADGALYWKAYTLNKLGRRDEAMAAIAELRKSFSGSRWLEDAKALELEVKQASGQAVAPEDQSDEDLKLMAINGLMQSDPDRAMPLLENVLKGAQSPRVKQQAIFVLAQNASPRAQQLLEQVAKGGGNPDLQLAAIRYIGAAARHDGKGIALLADIYGSAGDANVKRAVLVALGSARDKERLLQIARTEKAPELRMQAVQMLGSSAGQTELWQLYEAETSTDIKEEILRQMSRGGNADRLLEVARNEKDARLRRSAIQSLARLKAANSGEALLSLYGGEQDPQLKRTIVNSLAGEGNAKALVTLARAEHDSQMKREIVSRLSSMKSKEAEDYLMELLK